MIRDPLYRQILERLGEELDPYVFQDCVCDLLRDVFPGVVPISGGKGGDRGMDGAIADGEGEAYPLVVTTGADLRRNLESSIDSYRRQGGTRDRVVFATSREISPSERRKLEEAARAKGFTLLQPFDRRAIAEHLYRNSRWLRELLGLSGEPSALSALPPRPRPLLEIELVGRKDDLEWLRNTSGHRLLVGEPGSGKTFLLYQLAREGRGLFLASDDSTAVANALRELEPAAVLVDDAHLDPERLIRLRHLRTEIDAGFEIVAATWWSARDRVAEALGSPAETQIHTLEGLTRNEVVEVYRRAGVEIPDEGMRELVDQAANNPGLAITLAQLVLRGEYDALIRGEALSKAVTAVFDGLIGERATPVLAAFAIGGDSGMSMDAVAQALGLGIVDARRIASGLAAGGVLREASATALAVRPWQLRAGLVARAFFSDTPALDLPWKGLAELAPSRDEVTQTLILAACRGTRVPERVLRDEVTRSTSRRVWQSLAHVDKAQAEWVLDHYPGDPVDVLEAILDQSPEAALPRLLAAAEQEPRSGWPAADRLAPLRAWLREVPPDDEIAGSIQRREITVHAVMAYLAAGGCDDIGVQALCSALSVPRESSSRDPGMGHRITIPLGDALPPSMIPEFRRLWDRARDALPPISGPAWGEFRSLLREWSQARLGSGRPAEVKARQEFAAQMLRDLAARSVGKPGLLSELQKAANRLDAVQLDLRLELDPTFELLFDDDALATDEERAGREIELAALAATWARLEPAKALTSFRALEGEAREYRSHLNFWQVRRFGSLLAAAVDRPELWLVTAFETEQGFALTEAFLRRTAALRRPGWENAVVRCLSVDRTAWSATEVMLQMEEPPEHLLKIALEKATAFPQLVETLAVGRRLPATTVLRLLRHPDWRIAATAAIGEWNARPQGEVRPEFQEAWRAAILRARSADCDAEPTNDSLDFWLGAVLGSDADLALDWLRSRLAVERELPRTILSEETSSHSVFALAVRSLSPDQKRRVLAELPPLPIADDLLTLMIGRDTELYGALLKRAQLARYHLAPLHGRPDPEWSEMADLALQHGASPEAIVETSYNVPRFLAGSGVDYWKSWKTAFQPLLADSRPGVREAGRLGYERAVQEIEKSAAWWKQVERNGF